MHRSTSPSTSRKRRGCISVVRAASGPQLGLRFENIRNIALGVIEALSLKFRGSNTAKNIVHSFDGRFGWL